MKSHFIILIAVAHIVLASTLSAHGTGAAGLMEPGPTLAAVEAPVSMIRKVLEDQEKAWNDGDLEGYMSAYWKSEETVFLSGDSVMRGWQTVLNRYRRGYPDRASMGKLAFTDLDFKLLGRDAAVVFGRWQLTREKDPARGMFTLIFRKIGKDWRIIHDHTSLSD